MVRETEAGSLQTVPGHRFSYRCEPLLREDEIIRIVSLSNYRGLPEALAYVLKQDFDGTDRPSRRAEAFVEAQGFSV